MIGSSSTTKLNPVSLAIWWPVVLAGMTIAYVEWRARQLEDEIAARPPIAVLPVDASVIRIIEETPGVKAEEAIARVRSAGQRLADAGYVVLNTDQVYGYPIDIEARP